MAPRSKKKQKNSTITNEPEAEEASTVSTSPVENGSARFAERTVSAEESPSGDNDAADLNNGDEEMDVSAAISQIEVFEDEEEVSNSMYLPYDKTTWSPMSLYRTPQQMVMMAIRLSGSEGLNRVEIGRALGMNTDLKSGKRRVSGHIVAAQKAYPQLIDQYQQMDGKIRMIKYFWKPSSQPERFLEIFREFERAAGRACPFKIGQVIKFPETKLNTLRISDRSLQRLTRIISLLEEKRVIVTMHCLSKMMIEAEQAAGYMFQMDKKSLLKCLYALRKEHLLHIHELTVEEENVENKVTLVCHRSVTSVDSEEVDAAVKRAIGEFHAAGRVFPHGQLRFAVNLDKKKLVEDGKDDAKPPPIRGLDAQEIAMSEEIDSTQAMTLMERLVFMRVRASRLAIVKKESTDHSPSASTPKTPKIKSLQHALNESFDSGGELQSPTTSKRHYDQSVDYGYQGKMIRCQLLHEVLFYMLHDYKGAGPSFYEKFPPSQTVSMRVQLAAQNGTSPHVYLDEESYKRFLPPLPDYKSR